MAPEAAGMLDEAYQRLHETGPEWGSYLSNHGPMAAEAMARRGHAGQVGPWLDRYVRRLEDFPRGTGPIGPDWKRALGDPRRVADWTVFFSREVTEQPWRQVLDAWWLRLLPGVAAAATHGVIRVGHAVRALLTDGDDPDHVMELAHGLAYWAARWQPVPGAQAHGQATPAVAGTGRHTPGLTPEAGLASVPRIADQSGGLSDRASRLAEMTGWSAVLAAPPAPRSPEQARAWVTELADAAVFRYLGYGHGNPVMLVHSATAPTAILRTLPALDRGLWAPSAAAAWGAAAMLTAIYAPSEPAAPARLPTALTGPDAADAIFDMAVDHGDEHVIKFADTAADVYNRTGDASALAAATRAIQLIQRSA